jgi:succinoglycan biosynthesis transport protein ExoP
MNAQYGLEDVLIFIKRRKKMLLACFFSIFITAIIVALALPPVYKAEVRILRESQQVSEDYVRSTITSYAEERFNAITQKVITYSTLMAIIDQYNLYTNQRELKPMGALVEKMRDAINVSAIYENVMNDQTGRPISMSAAFLLSFEGRDPATV